MMVSWREVSFPLYN